DANFSLWQATLGVLGHPDLLTTPRLHGQDVGTKGAQALAALSGLPNLGTLHVRAEIYRSGVDALAACPHLARLHTLRLERMAFGDAGAAALAASPHLTG